MRKKSDMSAEEWIFRQIFSFLTDDVELLPGYEPLIRELVEKVGKKLPKQIAILRHHAGLGTSAKTYEQIRSMTELHNGEVISLKKVRSLEAKALRVLRVPVDSARLRQFIPKKG